MFRAIGLVILIFFLSRVFAGAFSAFEGAMVATFNTVESAAAVAEAQLNRSAR